MDELDLNHLMVLEAVVRERSIAAAARRLHMTPQAVSARLARLREYTGDALMQRSGRSLEPTARASELAERASAALGRLRDALATRQSPRAATRVRVRIAMIEYAIELLLPRIAQLIEERAPHVDLVAIGIDSTPLDVRLAASESDLVIARSVALPRGVKRAILLREGWKVLMRGDHPAGASLTLEEYCALPHALQVVGATSHKSLIDRELARHGMKREVAMVASTSVPAVGDGSDFAVTVPDGIALKRALARGLRVADLPIRIPPFEMMMAWHRRREAEPLHAMLRAIVVEAVELL
jgi:LysR family transcriptional activator of mexEF-oprN operon